MDSLVEKLKLVKVEGVDKVVFIRGKHEFTINEGLQIYYNPKTKTYVVGGEPRSNEMASSLKQYMQMMYSQMAQSGNAPGEAETNPEPEGFSEEDVMAVMEQGNVSKDEAIRLLRETGDVGNAVLAATTDAD
ncbi:NAC domain-containing protein [Giardia duodenalis]|uniref:Nascent polypeptide-associated complex subunit beta n=2 Tax=Giardia intestinalis TaxID=5741 RepID=A0A644F045_GIAIC|nr:NAC domain-containing protein [Giardia intestinalis]KAE8301921.1 NAC domain-containing protein [Giardia intestinalis]